ncbi:MAG: hypothetical protein Q9195_004726 [Heterodermia aff. obscurata]
MSKSTASAIAAMERPPENLSMVVVMGTTGAGKSYLINQLAGCKAVEEGASLDSCTQACQMVPAQLGNSKVLLIDTPGFDDTTRPDSEILTEIAKILSAQYKLGVDLKGVIYVHRITDIRYGRSSVKTFEICQKVCGDAALENVLLVTSRWSEVDPVLGSDRERQLRDKFWAYMLNQGSQMSRFHGDRDSAIALISQLLSKDAIVLEIQKELVDDGKHLDDTVAGSYVSDTLEHLKSKYQEELRALEKLREDLKDDRAILRQYQHDVASEKSRLKEAHEEQVSLHRPINAEVDHEIKTGKFQFRSLLTFVPAVLDILGMFVGIPPGVADVFTSWMAN